MSREVKADPRGRVTGARKDQTYVKHTSPDGILTYTPVTPVKYSHIRDVTRAQIEAFFGERLENISSLDDTFIESPLEYRRDDAYVFGLMFSTYVRDKNGTVIPNGRSEVLKEHTLIRILKDS